MSTTAVASAQAEGAAVSGLRPGRPFPQGATWDGKGVNFSLFSENAERVELCLFDDHGHERRVDIRDRTALQWHVYVPEIGPGQRYGYRVHGPYAPERGLRFNPAKLLIDPYAKAIDGAIDWRAANTLPYIADGSEDADLRVDDSDDAAAIPRASWSIRNSTGRATGCSGGHGASTVIYETHVKGFTMRHPDVPEELRGTYAGLASAPAVEYLVNLGVTAVELLPIHHIADESFLVDKGLSNYWGYSSIGYLAPHAGYSASGTRGEQLHEFKDMVKTLHRAGIEVIMDVVYNHTAEGNHLGPLLSFKGIDNSSYYRLSPEDPRYYMDFTGTGNSLNPVNPNVLRLIMDSLRYFVLECHVDGFRFDLAATLARELYDVDRLSAFFDIIHQDPILSGVKLIAEPWDVGPGGYQVGNFPILWTEWNGEYRDSVRDFWRGDTGRWPSSPSALPDRPTSTSQTAGVRPRRSTSSPRTTASRCADLVSYNDKHNEANGEDNQDGADDNRSWNCGAEGPTDDPEISRCEPASSATSWPRCCFHRACRCFSAATSSGRTQGGNNNAWCQDTELSWFDWETADEQLQAYTRQLIELRRTEPVFRRRDFLVGEADGSGLPDVIWFGCDGQEMGNGDWEREDTHALGVFLNGEEIPSHDRDGNPIEGRSFLLLFNAHHEPLAFTVPDGLGDEWETVIGSDPERTTPPATSPGTASRSIRGRC